MPEYTPKFQLTKPRQTEYYNVEVFNNNADILDTALWAYGEAVGTNEYSVTLQNYVLTEGRSVRIRFENANTIPSPTLNINGLGPLYIFMAGGAALSAGDIKPGGIYDLVFKNGQFQILGVTKDAGVPLTQKGAANGVATLDSNARIPASQMPLMYGEAFGSGTYTATIPGFTATPGQLIKVYFGAGTTNGIDYPTLNVNGLGAKLINTLRGYLTSGKIQTTMTLLMLYDGYYFFVVNDIIGNSEHSSTSGQYGIGSPSAYGHVKIPAGNGLSVSNGIIAMAAASTSNPGAVQLSDSTDSSSTSLAATANAVRQVKALIASAGTGTSTVPTNHASTATTYGRATATLYGHAMASSATPLVAGTASAGTDNGKYAREGHVHPAQTVPGASSVIPGAPTTSGAIGTSVAFARADHTHPAQTTVTGNAGTATSLQTARSIGLSGQASGSVTFNGSANVSIPVTVYRGGEGALNNNSGTGNSAWGTYALYNVTGSYNTAVGSCALQGASTVSGNYNTGVGYYALIRNAGGSSNTGVGCQALYGTTTGSANTALGADALYGNSTGTENTALGQGAMYYGYSVSANTAVGTAALRRLTSGSLNVAIGTYAGSYYGGTEANLTSSNNSTYVGHNTRANSLSQQNQTVIGYGAIGNGSNSVTLGNSSVTKLCCQVTSITALSDTRIKEDIEPANLDLCLADVLRLPLHRYKYKAFTGKHLDQHVTGWLADDVALVFPKAVQTSDQYFSVLDADGNPVMETVTEEGPSGEDRTRQIEKMFLMEAVKDITMTEALPTLWGAVQKLANIVEAQAQRIAQLEGGVA